MRVPPIFSNILAYPVIFFALFYRLSQKGRMYPLSNMP